MVGCSVLTATLAAIVSSSCALAHAGRSLRQASHAVVNASSHLRSADPSPKPGGPVAVQIDWLIENGLLKDLQGSLSSSCEAKMKESVAMSTAGRSIATPQKADDSFSCTQLVGRHCHSEAIFAEDKDWHKKRQPKSQLTIWDLHTGWDWCLPKACADTDDLRKVGSFMRMRIQDLAKPETAPLAIRTALMIDCTASGGGYVYVDYDDKWTFKAGANQAVPLLGAVVAVLAALFL